MKELFENVYCATEGCSSKWEYNRTPFTCKNCGAMYDTFSYPRVYNKNRDPLE